MKLVLTLSFWIFSLPLLFTQAYYITVEAGCFTNAESSIVLVSNQNGEVIFEGEVDISEQMNDLSFEVYKKHEDKQLHLSVINHYTGSAAEIRTKYKATTLYDISNQTVLTAKLSNNPVPRSQQIKVLIEGLEQLEDIGMVYNKHLSTDYRYKKKKQELKLYYTIKEDEDIYILVKGNDEDNWRYIYLPYEEAYDGITFNYDDLPNNLKYHPVQLNEEKTWRISLYAKCINTNKYWQLYYEPQSALTDKFGFYLPDDLVFEDFHLKVIRKSENFRVYKPSYTITAPSLEALTTTFQNELFTPLYYSVEKNGKVYLDEQALTFIDSFNVYSFIPITTAYRTFQETKQVYSNQNAIWTVTGPANTEINFVPPPLPVHKHPQFRAMPEPASKFFTNYFFSGELMDGTKVFLR